MERRLAETFSETYRDDIGSAALPAGAGAVCTGRISCTAIFSSPPCTGLSTRWRKRPRGTPAGHAPRICRAVWAVLVPRGRQTDNAEFDAETPCARGKRAAAVPHQNPWPHARVRLEQFQNDFLSRLKSSIEQVQDQVKNLNRALRQAQFRHGQLPVPAWTAIRITPNITT